jgi:hypothetical protein
MTYNEQEISQAFQIASKELGIGVETPFLAGGIVFSAYVRYFGRENGALILPIDHPETSKASKFADQDKYFLSYVSPKTYSKYNEQEFKDMLNDWGWFGPIELKPKWYTGKPWS